jgi:alkanesulfonate monooxygenase SsuD/methylene tetrahydromethanopterin reductase-like flavin-dependent oxidoreductase (luciferase family)
MRGFGIDATVAAEVAADVAAEAERAGYTSFWVNGSPPAGALDIITRVAQRTDLELGVGVFPLTDIPAEDLVTEIRERDLPQDRLSIGVGSSRRPGALSEVRQAVETLRDGLDVVVVTGAAGPRMTALAGEIADAVIFTWWIPPEVERSRVYLKRGASMVGREPPPVVSYIRCALLPQGADALAKRAAAYDSIPRYREVFARNGITAADAVVTGSSRSDLMPRIEEEEAVVDRPVIRAVPASDTVESLVELVMACAPE